MRLCLPKLIILLFSIGFFACGDAQNAFPDSVSVVKTTKLIRVKGTKFFAAIPGSYLPIESLIRYQKNDDTYFQVVEMPGKNFNTGRLQMSIGKIIAKGATVKVYEPLQYNGFTGLYMEGPSKVAGETKLGLAFGDETFTTSIIGVCRTEDVASKEELKKMLANSFYDKSYMLNPLELAHFSVDTTITGFSFTEKVGNIYGYSANRNFKLEGLFDIPYFLVGPYDVLNFDKAKELLDDILHRYERQCKTISVLNQQEIIGKDRRGFEITLTAVDNQNKSGIIYAIVFLKNNATSGVLFIGMDGSYNATTPPI